MTTTDTTQESAAHPAHRTGGQRDRPIISEQDLDASKVRLRVGVKGGGCSGFSYILDLTETQKETDEEFEQHGIKIIVRPQEPALPERHDRRLQGRDHGPRLRLQQPQRHHLLRVRVELRRLTGSPGIRDAPAPARFALFHALGIATGPGLGVNPERAGRCPEDGA
jgi:hypothetical protein